MALFLGEDAVPLLQAIKPIRFRVKHVEIQLFEINIQRNGSAAFQALEVKLLLEARVDAIQETQEGDFIHAKGFRKRFQLARIGLRVVGKDLFVVFGLQIKIRIPELLLLMRRALRIGDLSPIGIKAHVFSPP